MKFAAAYWLFGTGFALVVAIVLIIGGILLTRAVQRFGDEELVRGLLTASTCTSSPMAWASSATKRRA